MTETEQQKQQRPDVPMDLDVIKTSDKADDDFRVYSEETSPPRVVQHYKDMRLHHTVDFHRRMEEKYSFEHGKFRRRMTIDEAFAELEHYVVRTLNKGCWPQKVKIVTLFSRADIPAIFLSPCS